MSTPEPGVVGHTSDGIQEFDNPMPAWWLGILWITIAFSVVFVPYLAVTGWSQEAQYRDELAAADAEFGAARATQAALLAERAANAAAPTGADADAGRSIYASNCVACHGGEGEGGIGPSLVDAEWIHGGTLAAITTTVSEGVVAKGMLAWGPVLGPEKVAQVSAYVHGLGGGQ